MSKNQNLIKKMVMISILSAISLVLYIIGPKFSLPIFPNFLVINFSMLPVFIGLFMLGPIEAEAIVLIRFLIKLPFSSTSFVGETADLILGSVVVLGVFLAGLLFKGKRRDLWIFISAFFIWIIAGIISNMFSLPMYIKMYGGKKVIIGAMKMFSNVTESNYYWKYMLFAVVPFNAIISLGVILVTFPVHKRLKNLYTEFSFTKKKSLDD